MDMDLEFYKIYKTVYYIEFYCLNLVLLCNTNSNTIIITVDTINNYCC